MDEQARHVNRTDAWNSGDAYEPYVGRWSRLVAREFLEWLAVPPGGRWLEVGDAQALQQASATFDAVVSGLVLNFVAESTRRYQRWHAWCVRTGSSPPTFGI